MVVSLSHVGGRDDIPVVRAGDMDRPQLGLDKIERLVLTVPEEQSPEVFVMETLSGLYCTDRTVQSCQRAGIVGAEFMPIPGGFRLLGQDQFLIEPTKT